MIAIVYGALRSGTTLLRLMLDMHPRLHCPGEADFLFDYLTFDGDEVRLDRDALSANRIYQASGVTLSPELDGAEAVRDMVRQWQARADTGCLVLMLHRHVAEALRIFPDAPVLHMLRDPRDVARSAIGMGWAGTEYHGAIYWIRTERDWDRMMREHPKARTQDLRYENLIRETEPELRKLCDFFGVEYDPAMVEYAAGSTYDAPDTSLIEQWRRKQSPQAVGLVEGRLGPMLQSRGYAPSGHPPLHPGRTLLARLWMRDKQAVWRLRLARYGLVDPVLVGLGRRLGIPALSRGAQARMNRKQVGYLK